MITGEATLLQESGQGDSFRKPYRYTCNVCYRTLPQRVVRDSIRKLSLALYPYWSREASVRSFSFPDNSSI